MRRMGLSLLIRGEDYFVAKESEIYGMADRAYDGIAEPTFGEFSVASGRADILRRLRDVSLEYTRGALEFPHGQPRRAFAMCRNFDIVTHKMMLSGGILFLYAEYMRPGGSGVCALFADELRRCSRWWTAHRDLPGELKEYSGIAAMGVPCSFLYSAYCSDMRDILPPASFLRICSRWSRNSSRRRCIARLPRMDLGEFSA